MGEAQLDGTWRSVLVSGAGAGAQGLFSLDVTAPDAFSKDQVLWEFTDADHTGMGNVLGKRLILVGTGKYLETTDNSAPTQPAASFYALLDVASPIADRSKLQGTPSDCLAARCCSPWATRRSPTATPVGAGSQPTGKPS